MHRLESNFMHLYQSIRDRDIRNDISILQNALSSVIRNGSSAARSHLQALASKKAGRGDEDAAAWYRGLAGQVFSSHRQEIITGIEDSLRDLDEELRSSPWDYDLEWRNYANASQWHQVSGRSFWIEPAEAFVFNTDNAGFDEGESEYVQQHDPARDERGPDLMDRYFNYSRITHVYSDSAELIFDAEVDTISVSKVFEERQS
jgi:hypothetical protein